MSNSPEKHSLLKWTHTEVEILNSHIVIKDIELVTKYFLTKKTPGINILTDGFSRQFMRN